MQGDSEVRCLLSIKIKGETVSKWEHSFYIFQNPSTPTQLFGVIQVHLSGKSKSKVSEKEEMGKSFDVSVP